MHDTHAAPVQWMTPQRRQPHKVAQADSTAVRIAAGRLQDLLKDEIQNTLAVRIPACVLLDEVAQLELPTLAQVAACWHRLVWR